MLKNLRRAARVSRTVLRENFGLGLGPWRYAGHPDQPYGPLTYAQFGEDIIVLNAFTLLGVERPSFLDIGAHHPVHCSNTALLYARGSRGVCVEANPNLIPAFARLRPEDVMLNFGIGPVAGELEFFMIDENSGRNSFDLATAEGFVAAHPDFSIRETRRIAVRTLDDTVSEYCGGMWPDFLSLDAEGLDHAILETSTITAQAGPRLICVETMSGEDHDVGASMSALLTARGYTAFGRTLGNVIWSSVKI
jgi:FkbM family methyltransferase